MKWFRPSSNKVPRDGHVLDGNEPHPLHRRQALCPGAILPVKYLNFDKLFKNACSLMFLLIFSIFFAHSCNDNFQHMLKTIRNNKQ
jgi:hypothetical protein